MFFKKKDKSHEDELDILDDIKEPFSLHNFIEDEIIDRYKKFKQMLDDRGILFFLISPFQYRNRLLIKIGVIILGITIGVVPRSVSLINATKERNAQSELAAIANNTYVVGALRIEPLASSQYEKQHLLAFRLLGDTSDGVPSTNDKFNVELKGSRGAVDTSSIEYSYNIIPISNAERMLLVYIDNREQNDETGVYNLYVEVKDPNLTEDKRRPMEIILSNVQETTALFNADGVDLAVLTDRMSHVKGTPIESAEADLETSLAAYELLDERLVAIGMVPKVNGEAMREHAKKNSQIPAIKDTSSVRDIDRDAVLVEDDDGTGRPYDPSIVASVVYNEKEYSSDEIKDIVNTDIVAELKDLQTQADAVSNNIRKLNDAQRSKYNSLVVLSKTLNQSIDISTFTQKVNVK